MARPIDGDGTSSCSTGRPSRESRDGAVSLEALVIAEGVVQDDARCDALVPIDERFGQAVPGRLNGKGRDVFIGDLGRHPFDVTGLLLLTDTGGRPSNPASSQMNA
ncbi:MAG: hypothetical protein QOI25_1889 [Mycobacterium sp.]|nr:hypothetical protein [Mycobacterium sp.]